MHILGGRAAELQALDTHLKKKGAADQHGGREYLGGSSREAPREGNTWEGAAEQHSLVALHQLGVGPPQPAQPYPHRFPNLPLPSNK